MNHELQSKLYKDFPCLFRGRFLSTYESAMTWGLMVGDGWYDIIYELSGKLLDSDPLAMAGQVKEKFGTLRFYMESGVSDIGGKAIAHTERLSAKTCEACGLPGWIHNSTGWMITLCDWCYEEREETRRLCDLHHLKKAEAKAKRYPEG